MEDLELPADLGLDTAATAAAAAGAPFVAPTPGERGVLMLSFLLLFVLVGVWAQQQQQQQCAVNCHLSTFLTVTHPQAYLPARMAGVAHAAGSGAHLLCLTPFLSVPCHTFSL
jgi:hypothetical protein